MYYWHGTRQSTRHTAISWYWEQTHPGFLFFCFLCSHFSCWIQAGKDSDTRRHFPGCQRAALNESHWFPLVPSGFYSAQQMSKPHFRLGWESEGKGDVTDPPTRKLSLSCSPASPVLALRIWGNFCGNWGAGVMWPHTGTICFWREKWVLHHADSALPSYPWPQIHRQITATSLKLRVLWLGGISRRRWHTGFGFQTLEHI